ncbi:laminin subunit beta-1 [Clupea harengus]|uniref:Laminin subunit beta-1 n=1 Tax=Clupea harengus TaxID=7950 RepID=A0A6P8FDN8_CLUHA|nr:laminin subunit beta-1 [Clupea harengus]XP_031421825.1 laminin subunit beta-1 [Clupea harengus]
MSSCFAAQTSAMARLFCIILLALSAAAIDHPSSPHGCTEGSCYPATGNLLIGRAINLTATSTCGLRGPEQYCIVSHLQESDKCFECDSRRPHDPYYHRISHRVENVITLTDRNDDLTWWQAVNGEEHVSIRLNLEAEFHFTHLIMKFKTFRPAAMLIERSADFGRSWRPYRYFSYNCTRTFPGVPTHTLQLIDDVICEERYSDIEPSTEGEVIYKVLDPSIHVKDPYSLEIQEMLRITNLRINFTKLHTLGDDMLDRRPDVLQKYYYSLYELVVRGSCFCYGHASECDPVPGVDIRETGMIHGQCVCKHNTEGLNCERCRDFHNDLPWRPAELNNPHTCRECSCNGHSPQCHFDMAVYLATGNISGGVCDNCLHNTMGRNCEMCKPFYYKDPSRDIRDPAACVSCDCDPVGSADGGVCDGHTDPELGMIAGQCRCKPNVRGTRCDYCKEGHYGLSQNDVLGCQPCNCDPRGITMLGVPCDKISGDCSCKRYVTGRYCNQCLPEYWGLSNDMAGCRACGCDFGGAYSNKCIMDNGQCDCRPHLIGRQCADVQPGYFCASLDYYKYEAESAVKHSADDPTLPGKRRPDADTDCVEQLNNQLRRRRHDRHHRIASAHQKRAALRRLRQLQQTSDERTVSGFARVKDGAGLVFTVDNIPYAMEYDIMIRYVPESTEDWEAIVSLTSAHLATSPRCGNLLPTEQMYTVTMPHNSRHVMMPRPFCFEPENRYTMAIRFQRHRVTHHHLTASILIDSLVLIPKYEELPGFSGSDSLAEHRRDEMSRYMCVESFLATPMPPLAEMCTKLICSLSAIMHNGALPCHCDPQGSLDSECERVGGQCHCKPNVIGRRCDQCAPGTYGFGPYGCIACECHPSGSQGHQCDPHTGQCPCTQGAMGRQCSDCQPGQWGFPSCRPCQCNGHADTCDPVTGACHQCRDYTHGYQCERCTNGFYGNPVLGSGEHCRPCPCPGNPGSDHSNGDSCYADHASNQIICNCIQGYAGSRCDRCAPGYYGDPERPGGECRLCQCSGNTDPQDPDACDPHTGQCLKCLYNTDGYSCSECKHGYYGNALVQDCRRCTCVTSGTRPEYCGDGLCHCDRQTGACPCRRNIEGHNCDQCAPNHWNFGTDWGCEPCDCHPQHALSPHCNMFTGQCHCQSGFGGKQCTECEQLHWGDPRQECKECNCHPLGSESAQCDHVTGVCECREGATGRQCDECARGYSGAFPKCVPCHPCFQLWDDIVCQLRRDLDHIRNKVDMILETGIMPGVSDARIQDLERKLNRVRDLIKDGDHERIYFLVAQSVDDLRAEIALTDGRLMATTKDLNQVNEKDRHLRQNLTSMEQELKDLNATLASHRRQVEDYLSGGFADQFEKVKRYYRESQEAERQCNASVSGPESPVGESRRTRTETEDLLDKSRDRFLRTVAAHKKSLSELDTKAHEVDRKVHHLSHKVCGGHSNASANGSCPDSPCGGAGCRDEENQRVCGGAGCNGTMSAATGALALAKDASGNLTVISSELQSMSKKLHDVLLMTQDVKTQAMTTLVKAREKKDTFVKNNNDLKDFIQKIRDFLTEEGADPESIEKVAQQVLAISLPVNRTIMDNLVDQIKDIIVNLTDVEAVFNRTSEELQKAKDLLNRAHDAKGRAEGIKDAVNETKTALSASEKAIEKAKNATETAMNNLNSTREATATVEEKLAELEGKQMDAMMRLARLSEEIEALKNKTELNREMANEAKAHADNATEAADGLNEGLSEAEELYDKLTKKVESLGGSAAGNINQRAQDMKKEAEDLLRRATTGLDKLKSLEKKFKRNERKMQEQRNELTELERNVTKVREHIREQAQRYSQCT